MEFNVNFPVPVTFGEETCLQVGKKLKEYGAAKILCVYDKGIKSAGLVDKIIKSIQDEGVQVVEFDGVLPDPPDNMVDEAGELGRKENVDAVLGIGGGSSLDTAKAVNVLLGNPGPISRYFDMSIPQDPGKPLILIPTTAGTGSEVTAVAVLSNTSTGKKQGVVGKNCIATLAIVDPTLTYGLPPQITAATGMDTFAHAVESFTSKMNNPMSDILAKEAMSLVSKYLPVAVKDGFNAEARFKLSFASTAAGMAFSNAFPHLGHSIGHTIGTLHHVPHGCACGLALPCVIEFVADLMPEKVAAIGEAMGVEMPDNLSPEQLAGEVAEEIRKLNKRIGLPSLKQLQIAETDLPAIAKEAVVDVNARNIPKDISSDDILKLLQKEYAIYLL